MTTQEEREGPTPNGGVRSVIYYRAADGSAADRDEAAFCEIVEFDEDGREVGRTYGEIGGGDA